MFKYLKNTLDKQSVIQLISMRITLIILVFIIIYYFMYVNNFWDKEAFQEKYDLLQYTSKLQSKIEANIDLIELLRQSPELSRTEKIKGINQIVKPIINEKADIYVHYYDPDLDLTIRNLKEEQTVPGTVKSFATGADPSVLPVELAVFDKDKVIGFLTTSIQTNQFIMASFKEVSEIFILTLSLAALIIFYIRRFLRKIQYHLEEYCKMIMENDYSHKQKLLKLPELKPVLDRIAGYITEIKGQQLQIARLERLNLIGQMAAGISHEIRNPLTSVKGFLQLLSIKKEYQEDSEYLKLMISEIDRANSIITDFLSLAKADLENISSHNINNIVQKLFPMLQADAYNNNKEVVLDLKEIPELMLGENEMKQLILNLARNGLEVTPEHGNVRISTYLKGDKVVLAIKDQGPGIPQEIQDKIGTPFFTTKETGTGLGLAISMGIAQRHNAAFKFETGAGGTTFIISFPTEGGNNGCGQSPSLESPERM